MSWTDHGHIYFVQAEPDGLVKIGFSTHANVRIRDLRNGSPVPLKVIGSIEARREDEPRLHEHWAEYRQHGEWFTLIPEMTQVATTGVVPWTTSEPPIRLHLRTDLPVGFCPPPNPIYEAIERAIYEGASLKMLRISFDKTQPSMDRDVAAMCRLGYFRDTKRLGMLHRSGQVTLTWERQRQAA